MAKQKCIASGSDEVTAPLWHQSIKLTISERITESFLPHTYTRLVPCPTCLKSSPISSFLPNARTSLSDSSTSPGENPVRSGREVTRGTRCTQGPLCASADTTGTAVCTCLYVPIVYWSHLTLFCIGWCCRGIILFGFLRLTSFSPSHFFTAICIYCKSSKQSPIPQAPERESPTNSYPIVHYNTCICRTKRGCITLTGDFQEEGKQPFCFFKLSIEMKIFHLF